VIYAGSGDMGNSLKQDVSESSLENVIHFAGLVNREKIPEYFKMADYYIISSDYEGTSVSLLEAMFNKLPIIASNAPGINRMVSDKQTALLFETKNVTGLKAAMQILLENKELADSLASNAYMDYEEKYSYDAMIRSYEQIFSSFG
jgi:glycosyltransferase involved in cell wall biosynthesis